ncbi:MAG TPA: hypothetical protein VGX03_11655 [Candidatus Binatia bacterium]|jgi:hypothetical protein|nr:hypothetical protein [Candidatus Binatia bacterium]
MKKRIAKTISILSFLVLSVTPPNVLAGGGTCSIPSCRPNYAISVSAQNDTFTLFSVLLQMSFLWLP